MVGQDDPADIACLPFDFQFVTFTFTFSLESVSSSFRGDMFVLVFMQVATLYFLCPHVAGLVLCFLRYECYCVQCCCCLKSLSSLDLLLAFPNLISLSDLLMVKTCFTVVWYVQQG